MKKKESVNISFSAGVSMLDDYNLTMIELLNQGDKALYISKENGRGRTTYEYEDYKKKQKKILVVDDVMVIVNLIKTRLDFLGYEVEHARDGEEALRKLKVFRPDLMVLDMMLPKVNGLEVLQKIKEDDNLKSLKVIILSGKSREVDVVRGFQLGAKDYVTKPFSLEVLEEKIKKLL